MATKKKANPVAEEVATKQETPAEACFYTAAYLAENHKAFDASKEIVVVALQLAGKETATFEEAKEIIDKFKTKEVK